MLLETRKAIVEETEKLEKLIFSECIFAADEYTDESTIRAMMSMGRLMNLCNRNMVEEAELLTQIDSKLDELLKQKERVL